MELHKLAPIMPSADIAVTEAFYRQLGFETIYRDIGAPGQSGYLLMKCDGAEVHFFGKPSHRPADSEHGAYLRPSDIDVFSDRVAALGLSENTGWPRFAPAQDRPWGMREAYIWDPDGNLIRAGQEIAHWPK